MYVPDAFRPAQPDDLAPLLNDFPLGLLVRQDGAGFEASHLPFLYVPGEGARGQLLAHVARANPLWHQADGVRVLVVFQGVQGYVSPGWYPSKQETHRHVPTWNYEAAYVQGVLRIHDDPRWLRGLLARLTRQHEASEPRPWRMGEAPPDYLAAMLAAVVGVQIDIDRIDAKAKLSQNRTARDRNGVIDTLQQRGRHDLAQAVNRHAPPAGDDPA